MAKTLTFSYGGKDYTLEYTRRTVREMENKGFAAEDITRKPMTVMPQLFAGAFKANHPTVKAELINEIYRNMPNKTELVGRLAQMYNEPINTLVEEPEEGNAISWTSNWAYNPEEE